MGARLKLNQAYLIGWSILSAGIGLAAGSWAVGAMAFAILAVAGCLGGDIRPSLANRSGHRGGGDVRPR